MKKLLICLFLLFVIVSSYANIDTRLSFVSNIHNSPIIGQGTLVIDVEAGYNGECPATIKVFQDAFRLNDVLSGQVVDVLFSNRLLNEPYYTINENFDEEDGKISYIYNYRGGIIKSIYSSWTTVVRITIVYTMTSQKGNITWYDGYPEYLVINSWCQNITGIEYPIPFDLMDISLPVTLSSFNAVLKDKSVILKWVTESEVNNMGFEIWRSIGVDGNYQLLSSYKYNSDLCGKGNSTSRTEYEFIDNSIIDEETYWYKLSDIDMTGKITFHGPISVKVGLSPKNYIFYQNYPNPFNVETIICFDVKIETTDIKVYIFNSVGQLIKTVYSGKANTGRVEVIWDGFDNNGIAVPSGVYFAILKADGIIVNTIKMTLLK